jgi:hypothetical protein
MILREGDRTNIIISEAGKQLAFLVLFSRETPIGWARKLIQNAAKEISAFVSQPGNVTQEERIIPTEGNLPSLFNDALDQIWKD